MRPAPSSSCNNVLRADRSSVLQSLHRAGARSVQVPDNVHIVFWPRRRRSFLCLVEQARCLNENPTRNDGWTNAGAHFYGNYPALLFENLVLIENIPSHVGLTRLARFGRQPDTKKATVHEAPPPWRRVRSSRQVT